VLARFVGGYLGVPGPDEHTVVRWARRLGHAVFCDPDRDPAVADAALGVIAEFGGYIGVLIAARRAQMSIGGPPGHDALGRLLALQTAANARLDDRRVRELLLGVIACAVEPTVAAGARAILEIARRPDVQALARQAVGTGDHALLAAIVDEALRFAAPLSTPLRVCTRPYTLARGTVHETVLRPYTRVLASTFAAGFDPEVVEAPEQFRPGRPAYCAPKFGAGLHACVGRHIVPALLRAAVTELLRGGPVRAVADIGHTGPFPDALPLEFLSPG
jgi:cytochrome P450